MNRRSLYRSIATVGAFAASLFCASVAAQVSGPTIVTTLAFGNTAITTPEAICTDAFGNIYTADTGGGTTVHKIPANGGPTVTIASNLVSIRGLAVDSLGNVYVAQTSVTSILKIAPDGTSSTVGSGIGRPLLIALDSSGSNLYVTDSSNNRVDKINLVANTQSVLPLTGLSNPHGVTVDAAGNVFVTSFNTNTILELASDGVTQTTLPVSGLNGPYGIAVNAAGALFVVDSGSGKLFELSTPTSATATALPVPSLGTSAGIGVVVTARGDLVFNSNSKVLSLQSNAANFYGVPVGSTGTTAAGLTFTFSAAKTLGTPVFMSNGSATALFSAISSSSCKLNASIAAGSTCVLNVSFAPNQVGPVSGAVNLVDNAGAVLATTFLSGTGDAPVPAFAPGTQSNFFTSPGMPTGLTLDAAANLYVADMTEGTVSKVTSAGTATTLGFTGLTRPAGVAVDGAGSVYVSDASNNAIYKLTTTNVQSTVELNGLSTPLSAPKGITLDGYHNLYIADSGNSRVVKVDTLGNATVVPFTGLASPSYVAVAGDGDVYVSDTGKIYEYTVAGTHPTISVSGLGAAAGLAVDANGSLYIADSSNNNIYVLPSASGTPFTLGSGITSPGGLARGANGNLYVASEADVVLLDRTSQTLTFPATPTGATSAPMTAVVQNTGNTTLTYSALAFTAGFAQSTPLAPADCSATATVQPAGICNLKVVFSPTVTGAATGTATQTDNALNATAATQTIRLAGAANLATTSTLMLTTPASGNPVYGQAAAVTLAVAPAAGTGTPTGTATIVLDGGAPSAPVALTNGQAVFSLPPLSAGPHTVTATYSGDMTFATSTSSAFTVTVTPAVLMVTAVSQTRAFNVANASLTFNITGFVNSDTISVVSGAPTLSTTATTTSAPGAYPISVVAGSLSAANYTFNFVAGSLAITQAANTITFPSITNVAYGAFPIALTATASSGLPITYTVIAGPATVTNGAGAALTITGKGTVILAANQPGNTDYVAATQVTQSFTVAPATLTVTATSLSKVAGQANPTLGYTFSGFVNGDTASVVTGTAVLSTTATTDSPTGTYAITIAAGTLAAANYSFNFVNGVLTVTGSTPQTITFGALPSVIYGAGPIALTASTSSGLPVTYTVSGPATLMGSAVAVTGIGTVSVTATQAGNSTYSAATSVSRSFTVTPAALGVTTANASRTINTANPAFTYTVTGFVNGDTSAVVSGAPVITTTATTSSPTGMYPITTAQGTLVAANYVFSFPPATLTINPAAQTITFGALPNVTYGAAPVALSATASSSLAVLYTVSGPATINGSTMTINGAGTVSVTAAQAGNSTYSAATSVTQSFTVAPAPLTVTASNVSIPFGSPIPASFNYTITGLVNGDAQSVVSGAPALTTTATATSPGGTYPIIPAIGTLAASNYLFTSFVSGVLTISSASQTIMFAALPGIPQTTKTVMLVATANSGLPVSFAVASGPAAVSGDVLTITGPGKVVVTASQIGNSSYSAAAPVTQSFNVTATTTTALTTTATTANQGAGITLTAKVTSSFAGTPTGTVSFYAGTTLLFTVPLSGGAASKFTTAIPAGSDTLTAVYSGDNAYSASTSVALPLLVIAPDFNISADNTNLTIAAGQTASTVITLTPVGGYSQTLTFACGSLPSNLTCSFAPQAMNFYPGTGAATAAQTTTLTLTAAPKSAAVTAQRQVTWATLFLAFPVLTFFARRRRELRLMVVLLLAASGLVGLSGCGSSSSTSPSANTYNIPVSFNDGTAVTHTLSVTVTMMQ